eukprot:9468593-Pyramimonas_sp.AAC.1
MGLAEHYGTSGGRAERGRASRPRAGAGRAADGLLPARRRRRGDGRGQRLRPTGHWEDAPAGGRPGRGRLR